MCIEACRPYGSAARSASKSSSHTGEGVGDRFGSTPRPLHVLSDHSFAMLLVRVRVRVRVRVGVRVRVRVGVGVGVRVSHAPGGKCRRVRHL